MFHDRRRASRRTINRVAQYQVAPGALPRTLMITDISDTGARLYSETDLPATFTLSVTGEGVGAQRDCRVVWRLGGEYGVSFTDRAR